MLFDLAQGQGKQLQTWNGPVREKCILYVSSRHVCKIKTAILDTLDKISWWKISIWARFYHFKKKLMSTFWTKNPKNINTLNNQLKAKKLTKIFFYSLFSKFLIEEKNRYHSCLQNVVAQTNMYKHCVKQRHFIFLRLQLAKYTQE